jgi:hypothetical protein
MKNDYENKRENYEVGQCGLKMNGQKFLTNWFVGNFLKPTYKNDICPLNM